MNFAREVDVLAARRFDAKVNAPVTGGCAVFDVMAIVKNGGVAKLCWYG